MKLINFTFYVASRRTDTKPQLDATNSRTDRPGKCHFSTMVKIVIVTRDAPCKI